MKSTLTIAFIIISAVSYGFSQNQNIENIRYVTGEDMMSFLKNVTELGKSGFQLKTVVYVSEKYSKNLHYAGLVEFVKSDDLFEYEYFYSKNISTLSNSLTLYQSDGFSVKDSLPLLENGDAPVCPELDLACPGSTNEFEYQLISGNLIILERKNRIKEIESQEFVAIKEDSIFSTILKRNETLKEFIENGYFPTKVFYTQNSGVGEYLFVMETYSQPKIELQIVNEIFGFDSKIRSLTKDGFTLSSTLYLGDFTKVAVLTRKPNSVLEVAKIVYAKKLRSKEFAKTKMRFKSVLWSFDGYERGYVKEKLQFIEPTDSKTKYSYKIVKMKELKPGKPIDSIEPNKEAISEYKSLVAQGYAIKDLFIYDGINMLLEKVVQ